MTTLLKLTRIYSLLSMATDQEIDILYTYSNNLIRIPNRVEKPKIPLADVIANQGLSSSMGWGSED